MSTAINSDKFFGIPVYEVDIPDYDQHQEKLIAYFMLLKDKATGVARSNHGGWHSESNLHQDRNKEIQWMTKSLFKFSKTAIEHASQNLDINEIQLFDMWVNINEAGHWNAPHMHLPCTWSGCFYVKVPDSPKQGGKVAKEGDFMMINPLPMGYEHNRQQTISYTPRNGRMLLFPSYLLHMVCPHFEEEPRISVAFNFKCQMKT